MIAMMAINGGAGLDQLPWVRPTWALGLRWDQICPNSVYTVAVLADSVFDVPRIFQGEPVGATTENFPPHTHQPS